MTKDEKSTAQTTQCQKHIHNYSLVTIQFPHLLTKVWKLKISQK